MIEKKLKYPIKYAILPIEGKTNWYSDISGEQEYGTIANIVSKCYVIDEIKTFLSNGTSKIKYEVVFPYVKKGKEDYEEFQKIVPEYNFYSQCTNSIIVTQLFNSFEEALAIADQANKKIMDYEIAFLSLDENFQEKLKSIKEKHQRTLDKYKKIERTIKEKTDGIEITKTSCSTLEEIIERIIESPSEFYIKLANVLSLEEKEYLRKSIENRNCKNCTNGNCKVEYYEKIGLDSLRNSQGRNCFSWNNLELIGRQLVLTKTSSNQNF